MDAGRSRQEISLELRSLVREHLYVREVLDVDAELGRVEELHTLNFPIDYPREFFNELRESTLFTQSLRNKVFPERKSPDDGEGGTKPPAKYWLLLVACLPVWVVKKVQHLQMEAEGHTGGSEGLVRRPPRVVYTTRPAGGAAGPQPGGGEPSKQVPTLFEDEVYIDDETFMLETAPHQRSHLCTRYPPIQDRRDTHLVDGDDGSSYIVGVVTGADKRVPLEHTTATLGPGASVVERLVGLLLSGSIPTPVGYVSTLAVDPLLRRSGVAGALVDAFTKAISLRIAGQISGNPHCFVPDSKRHLPSLRCWCPTILVASRKPPPQRAWYEEHGPWEAVMEASCWAVALLERGLLRRAQETAVGAGASQIWLHVLSSNRGALGMYRERGFQMRQRVPAFYSYAEREHDALILSWTSSPSLGGGNPGTFSWASKLRRLLAGTALLNEAALEPYVFADSNVFGWLSLGAAVAVMMCVFLVGGTFLGLIRTVKAQGEAYRASRESKHH